MEHLKHKQFKPLKLPIDTFFFDCDSTLSLIEGIDVLATMNGVYEQVHMITDRCMSTTGLNLNDYRDRLSYVQPTKKQIAELAQQYSAHCAPGARETIQLLHSLKKNVYIISAGIKSAIDLFAPTLEIPAQNVLAVELFFDEQGDYIGFNEQNILVQPNGKSQQITSMLKPTERSLLMGDGMSDWEARTAVTRFVGYGGLKSKDWVKEHSDFFIKTTSFYPLIPLSLTEEEYKSLNMKNKAIYNLGLEEINMDSVLIKEQTNDLCTSIR